MIIRPTKSSREVHRLAMEMAEYRPEMQEEFMAALRDWELDMKKANEEAFEMGVKYGMKLAREEEE